MKTSFYSMLAVAIAAGFAIAPSAHAADGTITFTGQVDDTTCKISVDGGSNEGTVTLPTVGVSALLAKGQVAGEKDFIVALTECDTTKGTVALKFHALTNADIDTTNAGTLLNKATGGATKVNLQLLDGNGTGPYSAIDLGAGTAPKYVALTGDDGEKAANLKYGVVYYATGAATAGPVTSEVTYDVVYN